MIQPATSKLLPKLDGFTILSHSGKFKNRFFLQIFVPYLELSTTKAYCFITLRGVEWQAKDDPWKEQKKYIVRYDHPLGEIWRDWIPRGNDYEIIRKPMVILNMV